tara:strand:- start:10256 stop:10999 length:744 start_codon:yes stop_codon:yes gene_type:complete
MVETVVVNDQQENNPSLEEQSEAQDKQQNQAEQTSNEDRPNWLPEKFANAEELAKAYGELEKKQSTPEQEQSLEDNKAEVEQSTGLTLDNYYDEFAEKGELSQDSYDNLAKSGLSKELVDSYIEGQKAISNNQTKDIHNIVGGEQNYDAVVKWATDNLSDAEINAYNNALDTDVNSAKLSLQGIYAKYQSQNSNNEPNLTQGQTVSGRTDVFNSTAEIVNAINDKRYEVDTAYRRNVEEKLKRSNVL